MENEDIKEVKYVLAEAVSIELTKTRNGYSWILKTSGAKNFEQAIPQILNAKKTLEDCLQTGKIPEIKKEIEIITNKQKKNKFECSECGRAEITFLPSEKEEKKLIPCPDCKRWTWHNHI